MIDLQREEAITLSQAVKLPELRRNGRSPHVATIFRWVQTGVRGVRLEVVQLAGSKVTTREAISRFLVALTSKATKAVHDPIDREVETQAAKAQSRAIGISAEDPLHAAHPDPRGSSTSREGR